LILIALFFAIKPYIIGFDRVLENLNYTLIFMGIGISFSTLQDTTKTQNNFSKRIWESPKKGKMFIIGIAIMAMFFFAIGLAGLLIFHESKIQEISLGIIVLGIGIMGMLKSAIEMFENHRLDK
jgi:hypothetical protein